MCGGDQTKVKRLDQGQRIEHVLAERPHDVGVVILERETEIAHRIIEQPCIAKVAAKDIAGKKHALLDQEGALRIRPVQVRRMQEAQGAPAEINRVIGLYRDVLGRLLATGFEQRLQHHLRPAGKIDLGLGRTAQQLGQCATMIGLQMIEHDGGDFVVAGDRFQTQEKLVGEAFLHRIDDRHAMLPAHHVAVVSRPVGGFQDDVETAQMRIKDAHPMDARRELDRLISA